MPSPDADALYGLPREEFTKARNDLARELKQAGDGEAADEVKRLAKPSVAAWAVNQLVRRDPEPANELLDLGARMRRAQAAALDGDASELREVSREEREVVNRLADQAAAEAAGGGAPLRDRIASTLRGVVAGSDEVQEQFRQGRLTDDLEAAGFGTSEPSSAPAPPRRQPRKNGGEVKAARDEARARQRQAKETHTEVRRLAHAVDRLAERAESARKELERVQGELDDARTSMAEAEARLAEETRESEAADAKVEQLEGD